MWCGHNREERESERARESMTAFLSTNRTGEHFFVTRFRFVAVWLSLSLLCGTRFENGGAVCVYGFSPRVIVPPKTAASTRQQFALAAAPEGALSDIVIPNVFSGLFGNLTTTSNDDDDDRVWVPQTDCLDFRPLCFCVSQGYYVNLLRFRGGGVLGCHYHASPVHALTLAGSWGYVEHDWHATPGTYVFEPPGETHTLTVDDDCDEMVALFHVTGALLYKNPTTGETIGYDDVFTKLEKARAWYKECGLGQEYAERLIR